MEDEQVATSTVPTTEPPKVTSFIADDGSLKEGWTGVLDEGYRNEKCLATVKNFKTLAKFAVDTKRMVGENKIAIPTEKSTEQEWNEWYKAAGRPETADYGFKRPDNLPEEYWNPDFAKNAQELMHKIGLSRKQAEALFKFNTENVLRTLNDEKIADETEDIALKEGLHQDWGSAYEQKVHLGNCAVEEGCAGDTEFKERIKDKFCNDPDFIRFAANLGGKFAEHKAPGFSNVPTPSDIQTKINELMQSDAYKNGQHPGHKAAVAAVQALFVQKNKSTGTI